MILKSPIDMSRWHESGCRKPNVVAMDGMPCCNFCFAFPSTVPTANNTIPLTSLPETQCSSQMDLIRPSPVRHSRNFFPSKDHDPDEPEAPQRSPILYFTDHSQLPNAQLSTPTHAKTLPNILQEGEFRLLRITNGRYLDPIHVHFETASLRKSPLPAYEVLSYARLLDFDHQITCRPIYVGKYWDILYLPPEYENLLRDIRYEHIERVVWVDFLCINQADNNERTQQGSLMPELLMAASRTLMCIGQTPAESELMLECLQPEPADSSISDSVAIQQYNTALKSLFQQRYFSDIKVIQEVVLAQKLEIVLGTTSVGWTPQRAGQLSSGAQVPPWLLERNSWLGSTGAHLLHLLLSVSSHACRDPRDKVFGVLGLHRGNDLTPDYGISIKRAFTGVAAYLVQNYHLFEVLAIATNQKRNFVLPSWVPDWSEPAGSKVLGLHSIPEHYDSHEDEDDAATDSKTWNMTTKIMFETSLNSEVNISIDLDSGILQLGANRLCRVTGDVFKRNGQTEVVLDMKDRGTRVISQLSETYEIGPDFVFLLSGWKYPVTLRYNSVRNSYSVISTCELSIGPPIDKQPWQMLCHNPSFDTDTIRVVELSQEEEDSIEEFYSILTSLCETHQALPNQSISNPTSFMQAEATILDFAILSLTEIFDIESRLRDIWFQLDRKLGWMFLDQTAICQFLQEIDSGNHEPSCGEGPLPFNNAMEAKMLRKSYGMRLPPTCIWNLQRFCRSFIRRATSQSLPPGGGANPVLPMLRSELVDMKRWAEVSEQLLILFDFSGSVLKASWPDFPGTMLAEEWRSKGHCFNDNGNPDADCCWSWVDFRTILDLRAKIWDLRMPRNLRHSFNININTRLALRYLGLDLNHHEYIKIE